MQRITLPEIVEDEWFKQGYTPAKFVEEEGEDNCLADVVATDAEVFTNKRKNTFNTLQNL